MLNSENSDSLHWINLLPKSWRNLEWEKESYEKQLAIDLWELYASCLDLYSKYWEVKILDIWSYNSKAISELKWNLVNMWIPENKITLTKIDLEQINENWVDFINWDLNSDEFLINIVKILWKNSQWVVFMNQVSQYLWDRLKVIKLFLNFYLINDENFISISFHLHFMLEKMQIIILIPHLYFLMNY